MKAYLVCTAVGPQLIATSCDFIKHPQCLERLGATGTSKFIAHEVPLDLVKAKYGTHYNIVMKDPKQTDALRVIDTDGERIFKAFHLRELVGNTIYYEED